jgi:hypothetical protein
MVNNTNNRGNSLGEHTCAFNTLEPVRNLSLFDILEGYFPDMNDIYKIERKSFQISNSLLTSYQALSLSMTEHVYKQ